MYASYAFKYTPIIIIEPATKNIVKNYINPNCFLICMPQNVLRSCYSSFVRPPGISLNSESDSLESMFSSVCR